MKRVLVCEDEDLIRKGICKIVEGVCRDVQVQECDNGLEGYKAIAMWNPHVVITDIRMPVMDGLTATKTIRSLERQDAKTIPIIAMTANAFREDAEKCMEAGMNAHLAKPLDDKKIKQTISEELRRSNACHE
mgnify:CR=1 FL=1